MPDQIRTRPTAREALMDADDRLFMDRERAEFGPDYEDHGLLFS